MSRLGLLMVFAVTVGCATAPPLAPPPLEIVTPDGWGDGSAIGVGPEAHRAEGVIPVR